MLNSRPITLVEYYKSFKKLSGLLASLISVSPLLSLLLPESAAQYVFPPLGIADSPARIGALVAAWATTYFAFFFRGVGGRSLSKRISIAIPIALVFLFIYVGLYLRFVREIDISSTGSRVQVSVGYHRTQFANETFGTESDWNMLRQRGPSEEEIWHLWTTKSVILVRLGLLVAHLGFTLCLVAAFSWGVLYQLGESSASPP
jgi:hypothetical protein